MIKNEQHELETLLWRTEAVTADETHNGTHLCCGDNLLPGRSSVVRDMCEKSCWNTQKQNKNSSFALKPWLCLFTCRFTSVDPVRVCNTGYCKDICCQKEAPWNDREFIHVSSRGSGEWRGKENVSLSVQMWPRVLRDPGWAVICPTSPPSTGARCCGSAVHFAATLAPSRQASESLQLQTAHVRDTKASHLKCPSLSSGVKQQLARRQVPEPLVLPFVSV